MANEKRIIVEIRSVTEKSEQHQEGSVEEVKKNNKEENKKNDAAALMAMTGRKLVDTIVNSAEVSLNRYFSMSENYMAETDYKNTMNVINKSTSFAGSVLLGAKAGAALGPYGAAVGSFVMAASWLGNEAINYRQRMSNYYQNLNATNYQTEFDRTRLGLSNEGKGTEN